MSRKYFHPILAALMCTALCHLVYCVLTNLDQAPCPVIPTLLSPDTKVSPPHSPPLVTSTPVGEGRPGHLDQHIEETHIACGSN